MKFADSETIGNRLIQLGILLFLIGLLVGFAIPALANPRMGLSSHLEGIMNGMFLVLLGLIWGRLSLGPTLQATTFALAVYGTYANLIATLLAAMWSAGEMMPIAGDGATGTPAQEQIIQLLLLSLSLAIVAVCVLVLVGLRRPTPGN